MTSNGTRKIRVEVAQENSFVARVVSASSLEARAEADIEFAADVILVIAKDGSSRLLHLSGEVLALNAQSTQQLIRALSVGIAAAAVEMATSCAVEPALVQQDLQGFLADLQRRGVVRRRGSCAWQSSLIDGLAFVVLRPLLACLRCRDVSQGWRVLLLLWLARLSFVAFGWTRSVRVWQSASALRERIPANEAQIERVGALIREQAAGHWGSPECKERALCCWTLLRWQGQLVQLVLALDFFPFLGHCWCEYDGRAVDDDVDRCRRFVPILKYS